MWRDRGLSMDEYAELCTQTDVSVAYAPEFVEYSFARLGIKPKLVARRDKYGSLIAAFPSLYRMVFPNAAHQWLLGKRYHQLGDIGRPESLFPVLCTNKAPLFGLGGHFSPTTSVLLQGRVAPFGSKTLRSVSIAKKSDHKRLSAKAKAFFANGGEVHYSESMSPNEFADIYLDLHCKRWNYDIQDQVHVKAKILALYDHVDGVVITSDKVPVAAQLCYKHTGRNIHYVDFINCGVVKEDSKTSFGSIMLLMSVRRAEDKAAELGKVLRYSFGFNNGAYKDRWAVPVGTYVSL